MDSIPTSPNHAKRAYNEEIPWSSVPGQAGQAAGGRKVEKLDAGREEPETKSEGPDQLDDEADNGRRLRKSQSIEEEPDRERKLRSSDNDKVCTSANAVKVMVRAVETKASGSGSGLGDWNIRRSHVVPPHLPINRLNCREAWNELSETQRHFVHHFSQASWSGSRICSHQLSKESPDILKILMLIFSSTDLGDLKRRSIEVGITDREWEYFIAYSTCFLTNLGNYLALGDWKIVPGIPEEKFTALVLVCPLENHKKEKLVTLWEKRRGLIYSLSPGERNLGFPPNGCSAYYSEDITAEDINLVAEWMKETGLESWNTRIWRKESSGNYGSLPEFDLRIASSVEFPSKTHIHQNKCIIHVIYGDFKEDIADVVRHLKDALPYADNEIHRNMVKCLINYMETGSIESHKRSQELWLGQKDVLIEFNLGFVETYRDPSGSRGEFEGFISIANKAATKTFHKLIEKVDALLPMLPWPKDYEADKFRSPSFTCLEVFSYANGTIPIGINLPNYESVRQTHGSRNFCLFNVIEAQDNDLQTTFLNEEDDKMSKRIKEDVLVIQLAFHELLGHGSGKLFTQGKEGVYNFPFGKVINPLTYETVTTCYGPGETWNSMFGQISATFEECRAECVGIFLSAYPKALEVFGHVGQQADDITYMNWLLMARGGLIALEFFCLETHEWRQAHMQARFGILKTLLEASAQEAKHNVKEGVENNVNFLEIVSCGYNKFVLHLNRDKIKTVGLPAIHNLLVKLQVYKSTANVQKGKEFFSELTAVPDDLLKFHEAVSKNKRPHPMFVQINTRLTSANGTSKVELEEFEPTPHGLIKSYLSHYESWIVKF